ncbi:hypothetical protein [Actinoplanes sp. N902-109]|uniref:hypothetical protein n=1 Tax=Actinoplanes sp. (strain N902-109) TaxID=649831 RepID=UPI000329660A|nr:hypothetical protein [Actinoplanes sp. N902-109]AGL21524.1 hypothetical protein L083_8014 [Actinoplanes sp. N902-109]
MTDPSIDPTVTGPEQVAPVSSEEAAEIVRNRDSLKAGNAADEDAKTPDTSPVGSPGEDH